MKTYNHVSLLLDPEKNRSCLCSFFIIASLICGVYFTRSAFLAKDYQVSTILEMEMKNDTGLSMLQSNRCKNGCSPLGSEALPQGIVVKSSNLEMRPLWGPIAENNKQKASVNLLAIAVGVKQKEMVDKIIKKFPASDFVVMLFHYDGVLDEWNDLEWSARVIHVSAMNQTKWWFAKRFMHPDIVSEYDYIFLWDEDLGVENFDPIQYLTIVKDEGLEVSQPALDPANSEVHHQITIRSGKSRVHRRIYKSRGTSICDANSTAPPCVGWVEMMAPVFTRAAWRCTWYMIQNDLIHAWGLDMLLGYCAQGDRTKNVGVVDSEYVVHLAFPTLGSNVNKSNHEASGRKDNLPDSEALAPTATAVPSYKFDNRSAMRRQSSTEMMIFRRRWANAVKEDKCWTDPFQQQPQKDKRG